MSINNPQLSNTDRFNQSLKNRAKPTAIADDIKLDTKPKFNTKQASFDDFTLKSTTSSSKNGFVSSYPHPTAEFQVKKGILSKIGKFFQNQKGGTSWLKVGGALVGAFAAISVLKTMFSKSNNSKTKAE